MPLYNPRSSRFWFRELWNLGGSRLSKSGSAPLVEILRVKLENPTTASRARFHPQLWQCFFATTVDQTWKEKELVVVVVVVETYLINFPAHCARELAIEVYRDQTSSVGEDLTVGAKLNLTILLVSGQYIVSFDDDLYADRYVGHNVLCIHVGIGHGDCHATAKLGRRDIVRFGPPDTVTATKFWHSSKLEAVQDEHFNLILDRDTALAVSYVHLRVMAFLAFFFPYPHPAFVEDAPFMLKLLEDVDGLCLRIALHQQYGTPAVLTKSETNW